MALLQIEKAEEILIKNLEILIPGQKKQILKAMEEYANHISSQLEQIAKEQTKKGNFKPMEKHKIRIEYSISTSGSYIASTYLNGKYVAEASGVSFQDAKKKLTETAKKIILSTIPEPEEVEIQYRESCVAESSHARVNDGDELTTFDHWEAFLIQNYPSYYNDKNIMRMLRGLYELDRH